MKHNIARIFIVIYTTYRLPTDWTISSLKQHNHITENLIGMFLWKYSETYLSRIPFRLKLLFRIHRLNWLKFTILGLNLMFSWHRISVYSGFGLGRFHCTIVTGKVLVSDISSCEILICPCREWSLISFTSEIYILVIYVHFWFLFHYRYDNTHM